jgi:hypothetical protein
VADEQRVPTAAVPRTTAGVRQTQKAPAAGLRAAAAAALQTIAAAASTACADATTTP